VIIDAIVGLIVNLFYGKSNEKKSAKQASDLFHSIIAASLKGNPKPKKIR